MVEKTHFILTGSNDKIILGDSTFDENHLKQEVVLFIHGFKGFKDWGAHHLVAEFFATHGYRFIKFNLSHSGVIPESPHDVTDMESFAFNTISKELADVKTVINYIAHIYPTHKLTLMGHSRGGGLTILKGIDDPRVSRIVTLSAIDDFSSLWKPAQEEEWENTGRIFVENARTKEKMPLNSTLLKDFRSNKDNFNIQAAAAQIAIPWLIIHGDADVNVPFSAAENLARLQPKAILKNIEGANHVFGASHPYPDTVLPPQLQQACDETLQFLENY